MADLAELERLARSFFEGPQSTKTGKEAYRELGEQFGAWRKAAQPDVVLALLEERKRLLAALKAAKGYMLNAKFDLEAGTKKATAMNTLEGGLKVVEAAIAAGEIKPEGE